MDFIFVNVKYTHLLKVYALCEVHKLWEVHYLKGRQGKPLFSVFLFV